jgi:uncharacterized membrane protein
MASVIGVISNIAVRLIAVMVGLVTVSHNGMISQDTRTSYWWDTLRVHLPLRLNLGLDMLLLAQTLRLMVLALRLERLIERLALILPLYLCKRCSVACD